QCDDRRPRTVQSPPLDEDLETRMAEEIHEVYRDLGRREGWIAPEMDVPYRELPESFARTDEAAYGTSKTFGPARNWLGKYYQESNREAAKRVPGILDLVRLRLAAGKAGEADERAVRQHLEYHL